MTVPDHFWVALLHEDDYGDLTDTYFGDLTSYLDGIDIGTVTPTMVELVKVEEYYKDDPINGHQLLDVDNWYEAAFGFTENVDPTQNYFVIIWDGGYWDEPIPFSDADLGKNWTWNNWGGVNATDALLISHMIVGNINSGQAGNIPVSWIGAPAPYNQFAIDVADVNNSGGLSGLDALLTSRRAVGLIQKFPNEKPNFAVAGIFVDKADFNKPNTFGNRIPEAFDKPAVLDYNTGMPATYHWSTLAMQHFYGQDLAALPATVSPTTFLGNNYLNIYYDAVGDINASYVPQYGGFKDAPAMELIYEDVLAVNKGEEVTIPVTIDNFAELGALSLGMTYRNDLFEVIATNYGEDFAYFDHEAGSLNIAWASMDGQHFNADDVVALITVRVLADIDAGTRLFELTGFTELADKDANVIEGVNLKSKAITTDASQAVNAYMASNHPNPFNAQTTISYTLPEAGAVSLVVYNKMGQVVKTFVSEYQDAGVYNVTVNSTDLFGPGVYYYKLEVKGESNDFSSTNSMILVR